MPKRQRRYCEFYQPMSAPDSPAFATTRWSLIASAGRTNSPDQRKALGTLCATYWYPLYAYVRRRGYQDAEAHDLTQAFFAELLEHERLQAADQERGRFRSFLLASLRNFLKNHWRHVEARKRGGGLLHFSLAEGEDRYRREPADELTPEKIFERRWAMTLLDSAMQRVQQEYQESGKGDLIDALKPHLGGDPERASYQAIATQLQMTEGAVKVAAFRLRKRCGEVLREEIAATLADPAEVDSELQHLFSALA